MRAADSDPVQDCRTPPKSRVRGPSLASSAAALWLGLLWAGCAASPPPGLPEDPAGVLEVAAGCVETDPAAARAALETLDEDELTNAELEGYKALYAEALWRTGKAWKAFRTIRTFPDDHRFSPYAPQVEEIHYRVGAELIQSESTYFLFGSDQDDGELILGEFVERYATSPHADDALRLLGDLAVAEERWFDAQRRFEQLIQDHPTSEWASLASFRRVMAIHAELLGPEYDLPSMYRARNELRDYLATAPERPEFRTTAAAAYEEVTGWVIERHRLDADFYRTIGNSYGERFHLETLLQDAPADHPSAVAAQARLAELPPPGEGS
jgi:tetratricopeptide (TPR) repeat protein